MQWGTQRADALGLKAFVEASLMGRRLYEANGFAVTETVILVGGKERDDWQEREDVEYLFMEREAKISDGTSA